MKIQVLDYKEIKRKRKHYNPNAKGTAIIKYEDLFMHCFYCVHPDNNNEYIALPQYWYFNPGIEKMVCDHKCFFYDKKVHKEFQKLAVEAIKKFREKVVTK